MLELTKIKEILLNKNLVVKQSDFYNSLEICREALTDKQRCEFERLHKLVFIAFRNNTIKCKATKLAREILLRITELNAKDKATPLHIKRLISSHTTIESGKLITLVGLSQKQQRRADKRSFNILHKDIKRAHSKRIINNVIDDLTIKTLLLIHETQNHHKFKL